MSAELQDYAVAGLTPRGRRLVVTIDFEAFEHGQLGLWRRAMHRWGARSRETCQPCCVFLAVENMVQLRRKDSATFLDLATGLREMSDAGATFQPHNHYVFEPESGVRPEPDPRPKPAGYAKRKSFMWDVVHRHGRAVDGWLSEVRDVFERVLRDAEIDPPPRWAFRAGGWDCGSGRDELECYLHALRTARFEIDSSATRGVFGTASWRIGVPFGRNTFWLDDSLVELAPSMSVDCGAPLLPVLAAAGRQVMAQPGLWRERDAPGALILVMHFDHLLRGRVDGTEVDKRVDHAFFLFRTLRSRFGLESARLEELYPRVPSHG